MRELANDLLSQFMSQRVKTSYVCDHYRQDRMIQSERSVFPLAYTFTNRTTVNNYADIPFVSKFAVYVGSPVATYIDLTNSPQVPTSYRKQYDTGDYPFVIPYNNTFAYFIPSGAVLDNLSGIVDTLVCDNFLMHAVTDAATFTYEDSPTVFWYLPKTYYGYIIQNYLSYYRMSGVSNPIEQIAGQSLVVGNVKAPSAVDYSPYFAERPYAAIVPALQYVPAGDLQGIQIPSTPIADERCRLINLVALDNAYLNIEFLYYSDYVFVNGFQIYGYGFSNSYGGNSYISPVLAP